MAKYVKQVVATLMLLAMAGLCYQIIYKSIANQHAKNEYAELNHIKYGLFSVNSWKEKLQVIVRDEIKNFSFSRANENEVKAQIQVQLSALIDKVYDRIRESNEGTFKGGIKQSIIDTFVDKDEVKKGIPEYSETIMKELTKSQTQRKVKGMLKKGVDDYFDRTYETQDHVIVNEIIENVGAKDTEEARVMLRDQIEKRSKVVYRDTWAFIALALIMFLMLGYKKQRISVFELFLLLQTLFFLLLAGVTTPMIDMEAKVAELSFVLLDHPVKFVDQILYFQSKSIMDVFGIMIIHKDFQMKVVGVLMVLFSIIFPLIKLLTSAFYYFNFRNWRKKKWIHFFVFKSGKWSMTDVLIVAIFMAYIGFNGIITSQLSKLALQSEEVMVLATNGTSLQPGFYTFMTYAVLALFLTGFLTKHES